MRILKWCGVTLVALGAAGGAWLLSLPRTTPSTAAAPISPQEAETILEALKPPKRARPVIAIVGINDATEVTDYLMPFGVLRRADVADVTLLATGPGPVKLFPVLTVEPLATVAAFDAQRPDGADYVIVPAMSRDNDPTVLAWLKSQAAKGATIVGVCAGAKIVAEAGLLDGKSATTHWYYLNELRKRHPAVRYVANRRLVVDKGVATTTGISASLPMALTLIEAIAGHEKAQAVGHSIGVTQWDARHDSGAFRFTRPFAMTAIGNMAAFWSREQFGIELRPGIDEVSLALAADAWTRTYRSRAITFSATDGAQRTRNGVGILPDKIMANWPARTLLPAIGERQPALVLDDTLQAIGARYGARTADFVAMQLEYPRQKEAAVAEALVRQRAADLAKAIQTKDIETVMSFYAPDIVSFDLDPPLRYSGISSKRRAWQELFARVGGPIGYEIRELSVAADGDLAFVHAVNHVSGTLGNGRTTSMWVRWTACFRRVGDAWLVEHDHVSVPADLEHGRAVVDLTP
jgi:ketosteroid isomerase-like protein/putative intracellular protease/amidase